MNKRVDYIDLLKGIAIWGVVWRHTTCPSWLTVNFIFFILGGFFFKRKPLKAFLYEKVRYILIPFAFFYAFSYPYRVILFWCENGNLVNFRWGCLLDVFKISAKIDYLFVNIPLWFLLCFFTIQILYYFISYLNKWMILLIALTSIGFVRILWTIPTPFMLNAALSYLGFFAIGNLVGKSWIEALRSIRFRRISLVISFVLFFFLFIPKDCFSGWYASMLSVSKLFISFFILMSTACCFNGNRHLSLLRFYGENSLTVLGFHILFIDALDNVFEQIFGCNTIYTGFLLSMVVMAIMYVVILLCNKYIPFLVGKKRLSTA